MNKNIDETRTGKQQHLWFWFHFYIISPAKQILQVHDSESH